MNILKIVALSGYSGSGKDTAADGLVARCGGVKVALADPVKRIAQEVYNFSWEQLWGPSENREIPDLRYPRDHGPWSIVEDPSLRGMFLRGEPVMRWRCDCCGITVHTQGADVPSSEAKGIACHLTPRHALRMLGDDWGRGCYRETWAEHVLRTAHEILVDGRGYDQQRGLNKLGWSESGGGEPQLVVVPDVRYANEIAHLIKGNAVVIRIRRPGLDKPSVAHKSESEQASIPDHAFDAVVVNDATPEVLADRVFAEIQDAQDARRRNP